MNFLGKQIGLPILMTPLICVDCVATLSVRQTEELPETTANVNALTELLQVQKETMGKRPANFDELCGVPTIEAVNSHVVTTESMANWLMAECPGVLKVPECCPCCQSKLTLNKTMLHCHSCAAHGNKKEFQQSAFQEQFV